MSRERRNLSVLLTCIRCKSVFHPFKGFEDSAAYCSRACSVAYGREHLAQLRAEGHDPAHGGAAADKRRWANERRRAAGELMGAQLRKARQDAARATLPPPTPAPSALTAEEEMARESLAYLEAGTHYEGLTSNLLALSNNQHDGQTLILAGYGAGLRVEKDALLVTEGRTHYPHNPKIHTLWRGMHQVSRIVCLDPKGSLSFPAVQWCRDQQISLFLLDRSGHLLSALTPEPSADATLRRRQYLAELTGDNVPIVQELLRRKLQAQLATITSRPELPGAARAREVLTAALAWLNLPELPLWLGSVDMVRTYEGRTAAVYFAAWDGWPLRWSKAEVKKVPPHWLTARSRSSPLSHGGNARHAVEPVNAVLNYAYAVLEGQSRQALSRLGFDLACGFLHADKPNRESLVYDLMECARGTVDGLVLDFLSTCTLHAGDLLQGTDGSCRLHPQLARAVVAACRVDQDQIDAHARWLRDVLLAPPTDVLPAQVSAATLRTRKRPARQRKEAAVPSQ